MPGLSREKARELGKKSGEVRRKKAVQRQAARKQQRRAQRIHREGMNILEAMDLWPEFHDESWSGWRAFLKALFGLPLSEDETAKFVAHTGIDGRLQGFNEAWVIVGRRGGKSRIAALVATYLALFKDYSDVLSPGECGTVMVLAADRRQARQVFGYVRGLIQSVPMLGELVESDLKESIELKNRVTIEVQTASYRTVRGYTCLAAICDETAFWRDDRSANPDKEVLDALRPAMATVPDAVLLSISTPYARRGELWRAYDHHYGNDSDVLVWQAKTIAMNPTVPKKVIERAYQADPIAAAAEYGAEFRRDVEAFLSPEALSAVTAADRIELPKLKDVKYHGFADPSGGSQDSYTVAIGHTEGDKAVLDVVREATPPFSPEQITEEYAKLLRSYGISQVVGDRYAGEWPREQFAKHGVTYKPSDKTKSDIYRELLAPVNSGRVEMLDNKKLRVQLECLERRVARGGRDSIDHPPNAHDDLANAAAGVLVLCAAKKKVLDVGGFSVRGESYFKGIDRGPSRYGSGAFYRTGLG